MSLSMVPFTGLPLFLAEYRLQRNQGAALFARSPRTLRRWARRGRVPQHVLDAVEVIRTARPPLSASYWRDGKAATSEWSERLAAPAPERARRRRLIELAQTDAINNMPDSAARLLALAGFSLADARAQIDLWKRQHRARIEACVLETAQARRARRARYMRAWRRRT